MVKKVTNLMRELAGLAEAEHPVVLGRSGGDPPPGVLRPGRARLFAVIRGRRHILARYGDGIAERPLEPGELLFFGPEAWHRSFDREPNTCFTVIWDPAYTSLTRKRAGRGGIGWHSGRRIDPTALHVIRALADVAEGRGDPVAATALCRGLLQLTHAELVDDAGRRQPARDDWQAIRDLLEARFHQPINREVVARAVGLHPNHVSRLFRRQGGEGFHAYLTRLRQSRAAALIDDGVEGAAELAARCGYESANAFAKAFRRFHGCSPGEYARLGRRRRTEA